MASFNPDLNVLDFYWWSEVQKKSNATSHRNVGDLKEAVKTEWEEIAEEDIKKACGKFRSRLQACIAAQGDIFE